jgi:hypothetical protein
MEKGVLEWGCGVGNGGIVSLPHYLLPTPIPLRKMRKIRSLKKAGKFAFLMV